jgi:hypothetical protein
MGFRLRVLGLSAMLAVLAGLWAGGLLFSPDRIQARTRSTPLLPLASPAELSAVELRPQGFPPLTLRRRDGGWEAELEGRTFPASAERAEALAVLLAGLRRGPLASTDPAGIAELRLAENTAGLLVLHRGAGKSDLSLLVGARAPSGEQDYLMLKGQPAAYLVQGNLSVLLAQDRSYWLDLYLFPDDVQGAAISRIIAKGNIPSSLGGRSLRASYILARAANGGWTIEGISGAVDASAAEAMADALARLEGDDLLEAIPGARRTPAPVSLRVEVRTLEGKSYSIQAAPEGSGFQVGTSWSPWTYLINPLLLARAVRPAVQSAGAAGGGGRAP